MGANRVEIVGRHGDHDEEDFYWMSALWLLVLVVTTGLTIHFIYKTCDYRPSRFRSWLFQRMPGFAKANPLLAALLADGTVLAVLAVHVAVLGSWGAFVLHEFAPTTLGLGILIGGAATLLLVWGMMRWHAYQWMMTRPTLILLALSGFCFVGLIGTILANRDPVSFEAVSALFLAVNMIFLTAANYIANVKGSLTFVEYLGAVQASSNDDLEHYKQKREQERLARSYNVRFALTLAAYAVLFSYGLTTASMPDEKSTVGWAHCAAVVVMDIIMYLLTAGGIIHSPTILSLLFGVCRFVLIAPGVEYWHLGHAAVYFLLTLRLGYRTVWTIIPLKEHVTDLQKALKVVAPTVTWRSSGQDVSRTIKKAPLYLVSAALLTSAMIIEIIVVSAIDESKVGPRINLYNTNYEQWEIALAAICLSYTIPCILLMYRTFQRSHFRLTKGPILATLVCWGVVWGSLGWFNHLTDDSVLLWTGATFTPTLAFAGMAFFSWIDRDCEFFPPKSKKDVSAFEKYQVVIGTVCAALLLLAWLLYGHDLSDNDVEQRLLVWTIATVIAVLTTTVLAIYKYFATLKVDFFIILNAVLCAGFLLAYVIVWPQEAEVSYFDANTEELWRDTLIVVLAHPALVFTGLTAYKLWDDNGKVTSAVYILGGLAAAFVIAVIVLLFLENEVAGGAALGLVIFVCVIGRFFAVYHANNRMLPHNEQILAGAFVVLVIVAGLVLGFVDEDSGFVGFSVAWFAVFLILAALMIQSIADRKRLHFPDSVFPAFRFYPRYNNMAEDNFPPLAGYGALLMMLIWGLAQSIFLEDFEWGVGVASAAVFLIALYSCMLSFSSQMDFAEYQRYIGVPGIRACRKIAREAYLDMDKAHVMDSIFDDNTAGGTVAGTSQFTTESIVINLERVPLVPEAQEYKRLVDEKDQLEAVLLGYRSTGVIPGFSMSLPEAHGRLLELDNAIEDAYTSLIGYFSYFEILATLRAMGNIKTDIAQFKRFLEKAGKSTLNAKDVSRWTAEQREEFLDLRRQFEEQQVADEQANDRRRRQAIEQSERRERLRGRQEGLPVSQSEVNLYPAPSEDGSDEGFEIKSEEKLFASGPGSGLAGGSVEDDPNDKQFKDSFFGAKALLIDPAVPSMASRVVVSWKRPKTISPNATLFTDGAGVEDVMQGALGDCWLLSAFTVLSRRPQLITDIFVTKDINTEGKLVLRFFENGDPINVTIDDRIPCNIDGGPAYARSRDKDECWVSLLEKAFSKFYGSYEAIEGGFVHMALVDLTGGQTDDMALDTPEAKQLIASGVTWRKMMSYVQLNYLMGAGSVAGSDAEANEMGIVPGHAYALLDAVDVDGNKLVKLRNPWGSVEWTGDWSDSSPLWTKRLKAKVNFDANDGDDGQFWMCFEDFCQQFRSVYVCRIFDDSWSKSVHRASWRGPTAGGPPNKETGENNPQYFLNITKPTKVFLSLRQTFSPTMPHIAFMVLDKGGKRCKRVKKGQKLASSGPYVNRRQVTCEVDLPASPTPYTIFCSTFKPGMENDFVLTVYSQDPVEVTPIGADVEAA